MPSFVTFGISSLSAVKSLLSQMAVLIRDISAIELAFQKAAMYKPDGKLVSRPWTCTGLSEFTLQTEVEIDLQHFYFSNNLG